MNKTQNKQKSLALQLPNYSAEQDKLDFKISPDESTDVFIKRQNFICDVRKKIPEMNINDVIKMSFVWRNVFMFDMCYASSLMKKLDKLCS